MIAPPTRPPHDEREALIKEARSRQLRRRLLGAAGVAIAAAIGLGVNAIVPSRSHGTPSASAGLARTAGTSCGVAGGWRLRLDGRWSEPTGQHTAPLEISRTGGSACTLAGYPAVALLDAQRHTLAFRYSHRGDLVVTAKPPHTVHVAGHGTAFFLVDKYRCDVRALDVARWVRVSLPQVRGTLILRLPHYPIIDYCPAEPPSQTIAVSPLVGSLTQAVAQPR